MILKSLPELEFLSLAGTTHTERVRCRCWWWCWWWCWWMCWIVGKEVVRVEEKGERSVRFVGEGKHLQFWGRACLDFNSMPKSCLVDLMSSRVWFDDRSLTSCLLWLWRMKTVRFHRGKASFVWFDIEKACLVFDLMLKKENTWDFVERRML